MSRLTDTQLAKLLAARKPFMQQDADDDAWNQYCQAIDQWGGIVQAVALSLNAGDKTGTFDADEFKRQCRGGV